MKLPDLPDMMAVGMSLTQALAFWNYMMNTPGRDPQEWWDDIEAYRSQVSSARSTALH